MCKKTFNYTWNCIFHRRGRRVAEGRRGLLKRTSLRCFPLLIFLCGPLLLCVLCGKSAVWSIHHYFGSPKNCT